MRLGPMLAIGILAAAGCKERNPLYCANAPNPFHLCDAGNADIETGDADGDTADAGKTDGPRADAPDAKTGCGSDPECAGSPGGPACDTQRRVCVACTSNAHCRPDGGSNVCDMQAHLCYACITSDDCGGTTPVCQDHACRACRADRECPTNPGVCADDGHCLIDAEVIYVQKTTSCPGDGSLAQPFCKSTDAVGAISPQKRTLVLRGPDLMGALAIAGSSLGSVSIVGQGSATVAGGALDAAGIDITGAATVSVRDLRIAASLAGPGVYVHGNATLRMNRCRVENNAKGGIWVDTASADVTNTIVAGNSSTVSPVCNGWSGMCLNSVAPGSRFLNLTVVSNAGTGIVCSALATTIAASIVEGAPPVANCNMTACCTGASALSSDYHLTAASTACIDKLARAAAAPDDIDGQLRPIPPGATGMSDCGADEYGP